MHYRACARRGLPKKSCKLRTCEDEPRHRRRSEIRDGHRPTANGCGRSWRITARRQPRAREGSFRASTAADCPANLSPSGGRSDAASRPANLSGGRANRRPSGEIAIGGARERHRARRQIGTGANPSGAGGRNGGRLRRVSGDGGGKGCGKSGGGWPFDGTEKP